MYRHINLDRTFPVHSFVLGCVIPIFFSVVVLATQCVHQSEFLSVSRIVDKVNSV